MDLLLSGRASKEIAYLLMIDPATVHSYKKVIMEKLGAESFVELVKIGLRAGLIEL